MTDLPALLGSLEQHQVEFIIGGRRRHRARLRAIDGASGHRSTGEVSPTFSAQAAPAIFARSTPHLPFHWTEQTIWSGLNFTLTTSLGPLNLWGEIAGGGVYDDLLPDCISIRVFGLTCLCLGLKRLIQTKRAAGRPKDLEAIAELERILEEQEHHSDRS